MSEITITSENYENEVIKSDKPVLLDFWAPWCGPCKMMSPVISDLAKELEGKVKVCKVNVDEQEALASQFSVMSIPFLAVMMFSFVMTSTIGRFLFTWKRRSLFVTIPMR